MLRSRANDRRSVHRCCQTVVAIAALSAGSLTNARDAHAYEEQFRLGATGSLASLSHGGVAAGGFGASAHFQYGLSDAFDLLLEAGLSTHPGGERQALFAQGGALYILDVLTWVPYVGFTVGIHDVIYPPFVVDEEGAVSLGPTTHDLRPSMTFPLGLGYLVTPSFQLGAHGTFSMLFFGDTQGTATHASLGLRASVVWGN